MKRILSVRITTVLMAFCIMFTGMPIIGGASGKSSETLVYAAGSTKSANLASQKKARALISKFADVETYKNWSEYEKLPANGKSEMKKLAIKATKNCRTDREKIKAVYRFVAQNIFYKTDMKKTPDDPYNTWKKKYGVCYNYAILSKCLLNAAGIACMEIDSDIPSSLEAHAYNAAYDSQNKRWIYFDSCWASYNRYDNIYWTSNGTKKKSWFKANKIYDKYFDISASKAASLEQHGISSIDYMVKSGSPIVYNLNISKSNWRYPDKWRIEAFGIKGTKDKSAKLVEKLGGVPISKVDLCEFGNIKSSSLKTLTIPASLTKFGYCSFFWDHPVTLIMEGNPPVKYPDMIKYLGKGSKVVYPCSKAAKWKSFIESSGIKKKANAKFEVSHGKKELKGEHLATAEKDGYKEYRCVDCGEIFKQVIPATGVKNSATDKASGTTSEKSNDKTPGPAKAETESSKTVKNETENTNAANTLPPNPLVVTRTSEGQVLSEQLRDMDVIVVPLKADHIIGWIKFSICGGDELARSVVKLNSSTGWLTVKKGTKPGKYPLTVEVSNGGDGRYQPVSRKFDIMIEVIE